jgi:K+-transporting ATPase ATPase C chain
MEKIETNDNGFSVKIIGAELRTSAIATLALCVLLCGVYPVLVWGVAQGLFRDKANGSLIERDGKVIGSALIGQPFTAPGYFHPRPSAAGDGYDAVKSGGSNLGPISRKLIETVEERIARVRAENGLPPDAPIPADAVTASGSGLDPHISVKYALLQARRVALARGLSEDEMLKKIEAHTEGRDLGILGEPRVNVLELNRDLDGRL